MNVLLTSVGRRSYLVRYFQEALAGRGRVIVTNSIADTPGMLAADLAFVAPLSHRPDYVEGIAALCRDYEIGLLCSCHDLDTLFLATAGERLPVDAGVMMLPTAEWAQLCLDKHACGNRLRAAGFAIPWSTLSLDEAIRCAREGAARYPFIVKARYGFGSLGLDICQDERSLACAYQRAQTHLEHTIPRQHPGIAGQQLVLIQEHIDGPELCVILANDFAGHPAAHFITEVHEMRAGESDRATTRAPDMLGDLPRKLAAVTGHKGIWGADVRMGNGQPRIIDLNPRFTGDYPFQHLAGANLPAALLAWSQGRDPGAALAVLRTGRERL